MTDEELRERVLQIEWFHRIDLGGVVTPGVDDTPAKLLDLGLPSDLTGRSVIDVGAWDGFFSFEAERRGADVLATDSYCWDPAGRYQKRGFDLAREALGSRVRDQFVDVLDLSAESVGQFDLVLLLGVLYHMRHPLLALERVASIARDHLILETHVDLLDQPRPAAVFYPGAVLNHDPTNWWGPNPLAVEAMLQEVGFSRVQMLPVPRYCGATRRVFHAWK